MSQEPSKIDKHYAEEWVPKAPTIAAGETESLRESFSIWSLGALLICLMATWEALGSVVAQALASGGAPCLFYN